MRAKAEKEAAEMQAAAIVELAEATRKRVWRKQAQRALNDAINVLSDEQTSLKFKLALLQALPAVIENPLSR